MREHKGVKSLNYNNRIWGVSLTITAIAVFGLAVRFLPDDGPRFTTIPLTQESEQHLVRIDPATNPKGHELQARKIELDTRFQQAVAMLHAHQYEYAIKALGRVLELSPRMPEAHINMGYAHIGLKEYKGAGDFFNTAIDIKPMQINAYYGLALAYEGQNKLHLALSAMESYVHLADKDEPYLPRARAAIWEWNEQIASAEPLSDTNMDNPATTN